MKNLIQKFEKTIRAMKAKSDGATAIEYALIASATALALVATMPTLQANLTITYNAIAAFFA